MSTILDALRKVERDRETPSEATLDSPAVLPEARRRRSFPMAAVVLCAVLGFGGGAVLSWWLPEEAPVEVASLPVPPAPPAIAVPRPPAQSKVVAPMQPKVVVPTQPEAPAEKVAAPIHPEAVAGAPQAAPVSNDHQAPGDQLAAASAPAIAAPAAPPVGSAPALVAPSAPPIASGVPGGVAIAAVDKQGSALEPSPFGAPREVPTVPPVPDAAAPKVVARPAMPEDVAPEDLSEYDIALAPPAATDAPAPSAEIAPETEPEPEAPATVVDTGRSPPGAPKVALSFLQWSAEPARRFAFVSVDGAPSQRVHEGETIAGVTVAAITPTGIQFKRDGTTFVIRPRH